MHKSILISALAGLAFAAPRPQEIALDDIENLPIPAFITPAVAVASQVASVLPLASQIAAASSAVSIDPPSASSTVTITKRDLERRDATCQVQPKGAGPVASPDTVKGFLNNEALKRLSKSAPTPDGYKVAFKGLSASLSALNYMGLYTINSYDTLGCASLCDQASGCVAFNMYAERDPTKDPNAQKCPDPASTTNYKCTLWGAPVCDEEATNTGQYRASFHIVIAASNAYNKDAAPAAIRGFVGPTELGGAINAPTASGSYMGYKYFAFSQTQGYTPETCAAACTSTSAYNKAHPDKTGFYQKCVEFNSYVLAKNGTPQGLYCSMYNQTWGPAYATK